MARKTLKSHFKIQQDDEGEEEEEEVQGAEKRQDDAPTEHVEEESPPLIITDVRRLNKSEVSLRLSFLGKTAAGDGYTYLKTKCTGMGLTDVSAIVNFKHIQFVDVSNNKLKLENLQVLMKLPFLLYLQADQNMLDSAALHKSKYLQVIVMNNNTIKNCDDIYQPLLSTLELGYNKIRKVYFNSDMPELKCLDLRYNMIRDLLDLNFPNLVCLYLAGNKIKRLDGIETLTRLRILHLRNNPIKKLDGFYEEMKDLFYLNLRNCKVKSLKQVKKLKILPALETLVMKGTPYMGGTGKEEDDGAEEDEEVRVEIFAALPKLNKINKTPASEEERAGAKELLMQWIEEGDKEEEEEEEEEQEQLEGEGEQQIEET